MYQVSYGQLLAAVIDEVTTDGELSAYEAECMLAGCLECEDEADYE